MPRRAREKSGTGVYHVLLRGVNRQTIFEDDEDAVKFIHTLGVYKETCEFTLYAYCLMGNHVHLLLREGNEELGVTFRRIGASFVYWYNLKHERCGHLFQDRFRSETVEDERYFLTVVRYIHQNPLKAGLVGELADYPWSSYREYIGGENKLIEPNLALWLFSKNRAKAIDGFKEFHREEVQENCLDVDEKKKWKDDDAIDFIKSVCRIKSCKEVIELDKDEQSWYFKLFIEEGLSTRQISRITGATRWNVLKCLRNHGDGAHG